MLAERGQEVDHAGMADPPQPRHDLGLRFGRHLGQQLGHHVARVRLLEQPGAEVNQQPGAVSRAKLGLLALLVQPDCGVCTQQRLGSGPRVPRQ